MTEQTENPTTPIDNDREARALALNIAAAIQKDLVRFTSDPKSEQTPGQTVLADAKAFEAFIRTGRIAASHRIKPGPADG